MSRWRKIEKAELLPEQIHLDLWMQVDDQNLSEVTREIFQRRKRAITLYFEKEKTQEQIHQETKVSPRQLRKLVDRCLSFDEYGRVWGWRGLIPHKKIDEYELNELSKKRNESRKTGEFVRLFDKYPDIKERIDNMYLGRKNETLEPVATPKSVFRVFITLCREKKIPLSEYPFNTDSLGRRAVERYLRKLRNKHFTSASKRFGNDAQQRALNSGVGEQNHPTPIIPYQRVQLDGHRIDGVFAIWFITPEGDEVCRVLERFFVITLFDEATRAVLGYCLCYNKEYSALDVLLCIRSAVMPRKRRTLTIPNLAYQEVGGFPSEIIPETEWAVWEEICFDNAKSHLANMVRDRLKELIGCSTNFGPVNMPMRRSPVERFFQTLEANGFHRLPNTTGGSHFDPRKDNPEGKAIQYYITVDELEEIVDVLISDYNGTPNAGISYLSPIEVMQQRIAKGMLPRVLDSDKQSSFLFLQSNETRVVKGDLSKGKRPHIYFYGVEYRNDVLSLSGDLIGTTLTLHVNVDDVRTVRAFLPDGSELGVLAAAGKWSLTQHSLKMRKQINLLKRRKLLHFTTWDDPVYIYLEFLKTMAAKGPKAKANAYAHAKQVTKRSETVDMDEQENEVIEFEVARSKELEEAREKMKKLQEAEQLPVRRHFKAKF